MSIFPKKAIRGENVIIHVRITNFSCILLPIYLDVYIKNLEKNYRKNIVKKMLLIVPPKINDEEIINKYFSLPIEKKLPLGKYKCFTTINYFNKKSKSLTENTDFFSIEEVKISRKEKSIYLKNKSVIPTNVKIYYRNKVISKKLGSYATIKIPNKEFVYLKYADNGSLF